jgi:hypothetical protein
LPAIAIAEIPLSLRPPKGRRFTKLRSLPDGKAVKFTCDRKGTLRATVKNLEVIRMLAAEYR